MKPPLPLIIALGLACGAAVLAQVPPPPAPLSEAGTLPAGATASHLAPEQLDQLLGPIALYPDALIALILPAATEPSDVVLAARYLNGGDPAHVDEQPWDDSVRALAHYPELVKWMDENLAWTKQVGAAFLDQPAEVMKSVQRLRAEARAAGTLVDTPQQQVVVEPDYITIVPAQPDVIYVPYYDPDIVYVARRDYYSGPFLSFSVGFPVGFWLGYNLDWGHHRIWVIDHRERERYWQDHRDWRRPVFPTRPSPGHDVPFRPWTPNPGAARPLRPGFNAASSPIIHPAPISRDVPRPGFSPGNAPARRGGSPEERDRSRAPGEAQRPESTRTENRPAVPVSNQLPASIPGAPQNPTPVNGREGRGSPPSQPEERVPRENRGRSPLPAPQNNAPLPAPQAVQQPGNPPAVSAPVQIQSPPVPVMNRGGTRAPQAEEHSPRENRERPVSPPVPNTVPSPGRTAAPPQPNIVNPPPVAPPAARSERTPQVAPPAPSQPQAQPKPQPASDDDGRRRRQPENERDK